MATDTHTSKNTAQEWLSEKLRSVWVGRNPDLVTRYYAPDAEIYSPFSPDLLSLSDYQDMIAQTQLHLDVIDFDISAFMTNASNQFAAHLTMQVRYRLDGTLAPMSAFYLYRLENNVAVSARSHFDLLPYFERLGALPENAMLLFLSGVDLSMPLSNMKASLRV